MIVHNSPRGKARPAQRASRPVTSTTGRDNLNHGIGCHSPVHSKLSDELREYLADQPRLVLIGVNGVARPFFHLPFHAGSNARD